MRLCALLALAVAACGPTLVEQPERANEFAENSTDADGVWAFAKADEADTLRVYITNSTRPSCEDALYIGNVESGCPREDTWAVEVRLSEPYEIPGAYAGPDGLLLIHRMWSRDPCGHGSGTRDDASLVLDDLTDEYVSGSATFEVLDRAHQYAFSAPICAPE